MGVRVNERMIERLVSENILARIIITKENRRLPVAGLAGLMSLRHPDRASLDARRLTPATEVSARIATASFPQRALAARIASIDVAAISCMRFHVRWLKRTGKAKKRMDRVI